MRQSILLLTIALLAGCDETTGTDNTDEAGPDDPPVEEPGDGEPTTPPVTGGGEGGEDILTCIEASREFITDATATPQGAEMSPETYVTRLSQTYSGLGTRAFGEDPVDVSLTLDADLSTLSFVIYADENWEAGDPIPYGDDDSCEDRYEVDVTLDITAGTLLDETVAVTAWGWHDYASLRASALLAPEQVNGDLTPTSFDLSASPDAFMTISFTSHSSDSLNVTWYEGPWEPGEPDEPIVETFGPIALTVQ